MGFLTAAFNPATYLIALLVAAVMGGVGWFKGHSGKAEAVAAAAHAAQIEGFNEATDLAYAQFAKDQELVKRQLAKARASRQAAETALQQLEAHRATNPPSFADACDLDAERLRFLTDAITRGPRDASGAAAGVRPPTAADVPQTGGVRPPDDRERAPAPRLR